MASKRVLASVCMATLLLGTQAAAENTGVYSAANNASTTTATSVVEEDLNTDAKQIQLIEQAIREVEAQLQQEEQPAANASGVSNTAANTPMTLTKVVPVLQYQGQQPAQFVDTTSGDAVPNSAATSAEQPLYQGGTELSAETPKAPLFAKDGFELENATGYEAGYIQDYDFGTVNWLTGVVVASGESISSGLAVSSQQARVKTVRAATIEARKNLLGILSKIPVTDKLRVRNILHTDEDVMQFVRGDMQNSRIMSTDFTADGVATVKVSIVLRDLFLEKLIGKHVSFHRVNDNPYSAANAVAESIEHAVIPDASQSVTEEIGLPIAYTGLLIDAREVGVSPAITVNIVDEAGHVIYSPRVVDRNVALRDGMVEYAGTWEEGIASKRSSTNPLVLKAVKVQGRTRSNIVISDEQALLLKQINNKHNFLEKGRVVIVCK